MFPLICVLGGAVPLACKIAWIWVRAEALLSAGIYVNEALTARGNPFLVVRGASRRIWIHSLWLRVRQRDSSFWMPRWLLEGHVTKAGFPQ